MYTENTRRRIKKKSWGLGSILSLKTDCCWMAQKLYKHWDGRLNPHKYESTTVYISMSEAHSKTIPITACIWVPLTFCLLILVPHAVQLITKRPLLISLNAWTQPTVFILPTNTQVDRIFYFQVFFLFLFFFVLSGFEPSCSEYFICSAEYSGVIQRCVDARAICPLAVTASAWWLREMPTSWV